MADALITAADLKSLGRAAREALLIDEREKRLSRDVEGSLTDRALVLCLVTSFAWTSSGYAAVADDSWLACARAMAHTKPSSSRAIAVTAI